VPARLVVLAPLRLRVREREQAFAEKIGPAERTCFLDDAQQLAAGAGERAERQEHEAAPESQADGRAAVLAGELQPSCIEAVGLVQPLAALGLLGGADQGVDCGLDGRLDRRPRDLAREAAGLLEVIRHELDELVGAPRERPGPLGEPEV
jgi:hypothetical protein